MKPPTPFKPNLLVCRIGAVGDVCLAIPIVKALSRFFNVYWLIRESYSILPKFFAAEGFEFIPIAVNPTKVNPSLASLVPYLEKLKLTAALDLSHWPEVIELLEKLPSIPIRATFCDPVQDQSLGICINKRSFSKAFTHIQEVDSRAHFTEKIYSVIESVFGLNLRNDWVPPIPPAPQLPLNILLHPHSDKEEKKWPLTDFSALLERASKTYPLHCLVNEGRPHETSAAQFLLSNLQAKGVSAGLLPFDPTFGRLRDELRKCDLVIGTDSGPLHLASLMGLASFGIFGKVPPASFAPLWRHTSVAAPDEKSARSISVERAWLALNQSPTLKGLYVG